MALSNQSATFYHGFQEINEMEDFMQLLKGKIRFMYNFPTLASASEVHGREPDLVITVYANVLTPGTFY